MKTLTKFTLAFSILTFFVLFVGCAKEGGRIVHAKVFPDRNLETVIREAIDKPEGPITKSDLEGVTELEAPDNNIRDITGIEQCVNLEKLNLGYVTEETGWKSSNEIEDISPLEGLTSLTELVLFDNEITDITPLSNLTKLTRLFLGLNEITDITPLSNLTNLRELSLSENRIRDITPLSNLTRLTGLGLDANEISDITPLSNLTKLTFLRLSDNPISNITLLSNLTKLTILESGRNQIVNITPLYSLTNLTMLILPDNQITDITPLSNLTNLTKLWIWRNNISDIQPLVENKGIGEGDEVNLKRNPLNDGAYDVHIPALQDRGVKVLFDPKP